MHVILTHQNADFDAVASMLGAYKLYPASTPILPLRVNRNVTEFLALYRGGLPFVAWQDFKGRERIAQITMTDTQNAERVRGTKTDTPLHIIEHHRLERDPEAHERMEYHALGAITTYLVEQIQAQHIHITTLEATLLALGIYEDTGMLTYNTTTARDVRAVGWLLEQGAVLDTIRRFLEHPLDDRQRDLLDILMENTENLTIQGYTITLCVAKLPQPMNGINSVTAHLQDLLDADALFTLVQMPDVLQLVCRSADDAVNVGSVAQRLGGGGHVRAAAATIHNHTLDEVRDLIKRHLYEHIQPAVRVADLMSYNPRTVQAVDIVKDLIPVLRRIGHEGYPVLAENKVIGLLTLRDADRAIEHGLSKATVQEVMQSGIHTLTPAASVSELEQLMVNSGWGQIPVVNDDGVLIGIVTRTDLLKHWARTHPTTAPEALKVSVPQLEDCLGSATTRLIQLIGEHAQREHLTLYMVGGVVRDLLLGRGNQDIDFVVEGDGIAFAQMLHERYGGRLHSYKPFGTAKWHLEGALTEVLPNAVLPEHLDFATARNEFYTHPTALPTVYSASIRLDAGRRDFTINTLAVQLSPLGGLWRVQDSFGGMGDLKERLIRVLHSLSFVDDPTRIIRGVRFSERLRFSIEPRTAELIGSSLPMLRRITGERVKNEFHLLLQEAEPERGLLKLQALGALEAVHPTLNFLPPLDVQFQQLRSILLPAETNLVDAYWFVWMAQLEDIAAIGDRLLMGAAKIRWYTDGQRLLSERAMLMDGQRRTSQIVRRLEQFDPDALRYSVLLLDAPEKQALSRYLEQAATLRPMADGNTLKALGLTPGREYKLILDALRDAWLDGDITHESQEHPYLQKLIRQYFG